MEAHEYRYPTVHERPRSVSLPITPFEHDPFIDEFNLMVELGRVGLRNVSLPSNVIDLESYRHERNAPHAA